MADPRHRFVHGDITDRKLVRDLLRDYQPRAIVHFAAESHVDRSIHRPEEFVRTNVNGTFSLLEETRAYWTGSEAATKGSSPLSARFDRRGLRLTRARTTRLFPRPRPTRPTAHTSASKAASDHLVRAYHHTYGLPTLTTNCSNNYGPYQFPEKLIPLVILNAISGKPIPVYGDGQNVRDWLFVERSLRRDPHGAGRRTRSVKPTISAARARRRTLKSIHTICSILDELRPDDPVVPHGELITFIKDRPGHDRRYAIDASKIERELGWKPRETFETGIRKTVDWYLANEDWVQGVTSGSYRQWMAEQYAL